MKQFFRLAVMLLCIATTVCAKANDVLMATLLHDGETTVFYDGAESLKSAVAAAVSGDVINLSPGSFNSANIDKAVTIIGAGGFAQDAANGRYMTKLIGDFTISIPEEDPNQLLLEGFHFAFTINISGILKQATFKRLNTSYINFTGGKTVNCNISQCVIAGDLSPDAESENLYVANTFIQNGVRKNSNTSTLLFENCYIVHGNYYGEDPHYTAKNCIILRMSGNAFNAYYNCMYIEYGYGPNSNATAVNCWKADGPWTDGRWSQLTEEAAEKYKGTDGTVIGIYGGVDGWVEDPAIPKISAAEVDAQTSTDGKLHIKFNVKAQQ